ncbi:hypothetical protein MMC14_010246 [Varicellaria rhodocarpa]|nr:hypothetical protein [Varicellaria rhodocarpa]
MRLLQLKSCTELSLTEDLIDNIPPYAILSHTWGTDRDELTFDDLYNGLGKSKAGYAKIQFCGQQAMKDGLDYFWVDTCCINKANHAELSEAINTMFRWYRKAEKCYVYLSDVSSHKRDNDGQTQQTWLPAFRTSRWFTRGWTLQELLAPALVEFFSREGELLGSKKTLEGRIQDITGIPISALQGAQLSDFNVGERMQWAMKRNTRRIEDKVYCLLGIFDVFMSPIYGEGENAFIRLKDKIGKSYRSQLDEIGQTFFTSKSYHLGYHDANPTSITTEETSLRDCRRNLLTSLSFDQMDSRRSTIKSAYSTTCKWLLKHSAYVDWIDPNKLHQHHGFLWINGKPGAGKSTLMKFAHAYADRERPEYEIIVSFFFNARGDNLERSTIGMYRALLFHLLKEAADLQMVWDEFHSSSGYQSQYPAWTIELLREILSAAIARLGQRRLKCFIDALDECDEEQVREMVVFFEQLGKNAIENGNQLYICFASRHYPTIDIRSGRQLVLEDEDGHDEDLAKYVQSHLRAGKGKHVEEIKTSIQEKANGVFMWAVLVIDILNKEFLRGRIFAVRKRLQEIPAKLSDLFKDMLRRNCDNMTDLLLCLQWILFARRPLKREEFYFAMVAGLDPVPENMIEWNSERITTDDMNRFVLNSSKGLAELTKSKMPTVQFIHESVRDFLIKDNGLCELWPEIRTDLYSLSQDQLKQCCQNYLKVDISDYVSSSETLPKASSDPAKDLREVLTTKFPFLEYASQHVLYHADAAAKGILQDDFIASFDLNAWIHVANLFERYDIRRHTPDASLLYLFAENNYARLIRAICYHGSMMGIRGERYQYPLFAALANGHRDAIRALLQEEENSQITDIVARLEFGRAFSARKDQTPLLWALHKGHTALASILVTSAGVRTNVNASASGDRGIITQDKDDNLESKDKSGRTALICAVQQGWDPVVQLLLDKGADIEAKDNNGMTALLYAAENGRDIILQLLLNRDADIEAEDRLGKTALLYAAENGKDTIIQLLLDKDANIEAKDSYGKTCLLRAAASGKEIAVQLLLDKGADIEAKDNDGKTALLHAAEKGKDTIVQLLLDQGAAIEVQDGGGRTPLSYAAEYGRKHIVQLLLAQNANVATEDNIGMTPFLWIMGICGDYGHTPPYISPLVVTKEPNGNHAFLDWQMQLMLLEQQNKKRLLIARSQGTLDDRVNIIQLMLAKDAKLNAKKNDGKTALICAVQQGWDPVVQLLLDKGADIEAKDNNGKTALLYAAANGEDIIVQLLLNRDANIEANHINDNTPLG